MVASASGSQSSDPTVTFAGATPPEIHEFRARGVRPRIWRKFGCRGSGSFATESGHPGWLGANRRTWLLCSAGERWTVGGGVQLVRIVGASAGVEIGKGVWEGR